MIFTCEILVSKVEFWGALVKDSHALYLSPSQKIWSLSLWDRAYAWYKLHYSRAILFFLCFWAVFRLLKNGFRKIISESRFKVTALLIRDHKVWKPFNHHYPASYFPIYPIFHPFFTISESPIPIYSSLLAICSICLGLKRT